MTVSVFQKQRVHPMARKCSAGHALVRWDQQPCPGGHVHMVAVCPMRVGNRRCGEQVALPPFTNSCGDTRDEDR